MQILTLSTPSPTSETKCGGNENLLLLSNRTHWSFTYEPYSRLMILPALPVGPTFSSELKTSHWLCHRRMCDHVSCERNVTIPGNVCSPTRLIQLLTNSFSPFLCFALHFDHIQPIFILPESCNAETIETLYRHVMKTRLPTILQSCI